MAKHCLILRLIKNVILPVAEAPYRCCLLPPGPCVNLPAAWLQGIASPWEDQYLILSSPGSPPLWPMSCHCHVTKGKDQEKQEEKPSNKEKTPGRRAAGRASENQHEKQLKALALELHRPWDSARPASRSFGIFMLFF